MIRKFLVLPCLMLILCFSVEASVADSKRVEFTFAYDIQEGYPSFMGNGEGVPEESPGTYIEIMRLVAKDLPIKLNLVRLPWGRCKAYLKANKVDGINSSFRASRSKIGIFPRTRSGEIDRDRRITSDTYRLYAKKGADIYFDPTTNRIINNSKGVLAPMGYSIVSDLKSNGVNIKEVPSGVDGILTMLALGRASGAIAHESQANFILTRNAASLSQITPVEPPIKEKDYFILISKGFYNEHPELSEKIWDKIGEQRRTNLPQILQRYMVDLPQNLTR